MAGFLYISVSCCCCCCSIISTIYIRMQQSFCVFCLLVVYIFKTCNLTTFSMIFSFWVLKGIMYSFKSLFLKYMCIYYSCLDLLIESVCQSTISQKQKQQIYIYIYIYILDLSRLYVKIGCCNKGNIFLLSG